MNIDNTLPEAAAAAPQTTLTGQAPVAPILTDAETKPRHDASPPTAPKLRRTPRKPRVTLPPVTPS